MYSMILLQAGDNAGLMNILMIVAIIVIFYFFMIRPQQKKQKEIKKFRESLTVGSNVVTAGGIYGKIRKVRDTTFDLEIARDTVISIDKGSVYPSAIEAQQDADAEKKANN
ncbi:MAG: preprotein translocase subunit YajC [Paramuribaculum sp.]